MPPYVAGLFSPFFNAFPLTCITVKPPNKRDIDLCEIFECAHLKFTVSGQSIDIHMRTQCSHASVELAQARPIKGYQVHILKDLKLCRFITRCNAYLVRCAIYHM